MGVIVPQVVSEDRASGALVVDGSLRVEGSNGQKLERTPSSVGNNKTWTFSTWYRKPKISDVQDMIFTAGTGEAVRTQLYMNYDNLYFYHTESPEGTNSILVSGNSYLRDPSGWYHILCVCDIPNGYVRVYVNNRLDINKSDVNTSYITQVNLAHKHAIANHSFAAYSNPFSAYFSHTYLIDGQALGPEYFGYTDPLTNVWRPKKYKNTITLPGDSGGAVGFGTNGFYLPFDGSAPIGQDQSGRGNNWTPVNFGGSNTIEKATGALPILNTDGGGKVARVGVRTDANASSLVLALPLVGIKSDFSNAVNSGTSNKAITANGNAAASSAQSNFYGGSFDFDGNDDRLTVAQSSDMEIESVDFTVEAWIYPEDITSGDAALNGIISRRRYGVTEGWVLNINNGKLAFFGQINGSWTSPSWIDGATTITVNRWYHVAVTRQSNTVRLFLNGVLDATGTLTSGITAAASSALLAIGDISGDTQQGAFDGKIQDVRIYKGAAKYTSNFIPASTDPDIVPDSPSGVSYSSNVALPPITDGGAVAFDGSGDYLTPPSTTDFAFGTGDFTVEFFVNPSALGNIDFFSFTDDRTNIGFNANGAITYYDGGVNTSPNNQLSIGRWTHVAVTKSGTAMNIWVNGISVLSFTSTYNAGSSARTANIGARFDGSGNYFNGFASNFHVVKGTALYTANFTPPSAPISSVANTKLLCCKSNSSATAADVTPGTITANGNAAATNFNPFTANINTQRGKQSGYATLNPLRCLSAITLSNGNLNLAYGSATTGHVSATVGVSTGKWYWEYTQTSVGSMIGISDEILLPTQYAGQTSTTWGYFGRDSDLYNSGTNTSYGTTWGTGDTVGVAFDATNRNLSFYKNGVYLGIAASGIATGTYYPAFSRGSDTPAGNANFGQKPFKFPPPAGFQPLALANTPRPTIVRPDQYVGIVTGNFDTTKTWDVGFQPDLIWFKSRGNTDTHLLQDSVNGVNSFVSTATTAAATSFPVGGLYGVTSFNRNGWTQGSYGLISNTSMVAWCWKAGGSGGGLSFWKDGVGYATAAGAGLTGGSVTPTAASVNTKSGFSIIKYAGGAGGSFASYSHGLGNSPKFYMIKNLTSSSTEWVIYHESLGNTKGLYFNDAAFTTNDWWNDTSPTSSLFYTKIASLYLNSSSNNYIAYLWAEIPGFSKFGSYTGTGNSSTGPFVYTGFRPAWVMFRNTGSGQYWGIYDNKRDLYNPETNYLRAESSATEGTSSGDVVDFLSNGFKIRSAFGFNNGNGATIIYAAFAEAPTFNLYGGQANAR